MFIALKDGFFVQNSSSFEHSTGFETNDDFKNTEIKHDKLNVSNNEAGKNKKKIYNRHSSLRLFKF